MGNSNPAIDWGCRPITVVTVGAPFQPGQCVSVVASSEPADSDAGVSEFIGRAGVVSYLEYSCGCGQRFPDDPMIGVRFADGRMEEFWREELMAK